MNRFGNNAYVLVESNDVLRESTYTPPRQLACGETPEKPARICKICESCCKHQQLRGSAILTFKGGFKVSSGTV